MSRNRLNLVVDLLGYLAMAGLAGTGSIMYFRLPPEAGSDALAGLTRHQWGDIHAYIALSLLALIVIHIVLHWTWVTHTIGALLPRKEPEKAGAGAGGSVLLIVLGAAAAAAIALPWLGEVQRGAGRGQGEGKGFHGGRAGVGTSDAAAKPAAAPGEHAGGQAQEIRGSSTLAEVAEAAGVPLARILAELKLPADTPAAERLGRLRQQYGFAMEDVRGLVARLRGDPKATD